MFSRDPDKPPKVTPELSQLVDQLGLKLVHVSLLPTDRNPADGGSLSFMAMTDFLPRAGEYIRTQDNVLCEVKMVLHSVNPHPRNGKAAGFGLVPTVVAVRAEEG